MAYPKRVRALNICHQEKAILEHAGFIRFVSGKVKKYGLENVLKAKASKDDEPDLVWLKKAYIKVLDFAQDIQLKTITEKHEVRTDQTITVVFEKDNSENRIQAPRFATPSIQ